MAIGMPPVDVFPSSIFIGYAMPAVASEITVLVRGSTVHVRGVRLLSSTQVKSALSGSKGLGSAADALADAYEIAGWRNILVVPVDQRGPLILVAYETGLVGVHGFQPLQTYFQDFVGSAPIRYSTFAIAVQMAELHSLRTGADARALYQRSVQEPAQQTMIIEGTHPNQLQFDYQLRMSNEGNRFVGRWFGGVAATATTPSSARLGLSYDRVLPELGGARGAPRYDGYSAFTDKVTRFGLLKVLASYTSYQYRGIGAETFTPGVSTPDPELKASNLHIGGQGERFLYISPRWRWSLGAGALHNEYEIKQIGTTAFASETYTAANVNASIKWILPDYESRPQAFFDAQFRQSLEADIRNTGATTDFRIYNYSAGVSISPFDFGIVSLTYEGQWTGDTLPQAEQWVLGGFDRLSAWLPGVSIGDRGTLARFCYQIPLVNEPMHHLKFAATLERGTSEFDNGAARLRSSLSSAGIALTYRYAKNWFLEGRVGRSLQHDAPAEFAISKQTAGFYVRAARLFDAP